MERYASTLATTAACIGLMVAGHLAILHERASVPDEPVKAQAVAAHAAATETRVWVEPPAKSEPLAKPDLHAAETTGTAASPEPAAVAEAQPVVQAPVQHTALKADRTADKAQRAAEQAKRRKLAQAKARRTQTASRDLAADQGAVPDTAPRSEPVAAPRVDPIGDLLRGLGIGRES